MGVDQERHRPGLLKQQNKAHKHGRHRSKGAIHIAEKGRTSVKSVSRRFKSLSSKDERRNQMVQNRLKKRLETLNKKRQLGTTRNAPFLVAVVPLNFFADTDKLMNLIQNSCEGNDIAKSPEGFLHITVNRLKQKFSFVIPQKGNLYATLDTLKVADTVLFVVSAVADNVIDEVSESFLMAILAQGLPSTSVVTLNLENVPQKKRSNVKQNIQKIISQWLPEEKVINVDKEMDALNLLRKIGGQKQRKISHRERRPYLLAEQLEFINEENNVGVLKVSGYLRGQMLSANSLVHIPGWGDFQIRQIDGHSFSNLGSKDSEVNVLQVADPIKQRSLVSENIPDPMDAEQTWPTAEELEQAKEEQKKKKLIKKIPKGMSDYQACWIPDEAIEELNESDSFEDDDFEGEKAMDDSDDESQKKVKFLDEDEEFETVTVTEGEVDPEKYDASMDLDEEKEAQEKIKEAKMDQMYPDEVDTPQDIPARERFQKYRGLSSFRTSPWDPKENLPFDYAKIFQFENFNRTRKRIFSEIENEVSDGVTPGKYITIHVDKVRAELYQSRSSFEPLVIFGMLEHEQKMSVVNVLLKRCQNTPWADIPIKSKEELLFQCGYRRFKARPIFSEHTNGTKHKYQRFFQPSSITVATLFAPIMFPPASVLVFKENPNSTQDVIATGNLLSVNPDRLVIKRVVLSGHPFKVNKKSAVVRFMFFNREDINWFKPVELRTKYGRRGHIREPLGTHGHMKTVFDGQLKSQDTVLMFLYKRIFPKWSYDPTVKYTSSKYKMLPTITEEESEEMSVN